MYEKLEVRTMYDIVKFNSDNTSIDTNQMHFIRFLRKTNVK